MRTILQELKLRVKQIFTYKATLGCVGAGLRGAVSPFLFPAPLTPWIQEGQSSSALQNKQTSVYYLKTRGSLRMGQSQQGTYQY